jgi:putative phage-type endonuclease
MFTVQATQILEAGASRETWLATRQTGIGGSDVATILGLNKWKSAYSLWAERIGLVDNQTNESEAMEWGTRLESVIAAKFQEAHPELEVNTEVGTWASIARPWQIANPDGIYRTEDDVYGVLEIKTATYEDDWAHGVPRYYRTQVQWYLHTLGLGEATVAVLFHGNKYREYQIIADPFEQQLNMERVQQFLTLVDAGVAPELDGSDSTQESLKAQHPLIDPTILFDATEYAPAYFTTKRELDEATEAHNVAKAQLLLAMGNAKTGYVYEQPVFARQARGEGRPFLVIKKQQAKE